jgi:glycosyltransferase involved in cell wall biosynthesis
MDNQPLVSVLMPVYNGRDYLRPAIDCILAQSYANLELIIVNDGSKDDTQDIIDSYTDKRIVAIKQENQGVARSLNNGLKVAKGKYVRRHDADDISTPDSIKIQVDFLEQHPDFVMVCGQQAFMTAKGLIAYDFRLPQNKFFKERPMVELTLQDFRADSASPVVHGTACFRRAEVVEIGCYRPEYIVSEDNDLWMRLLEKYKIGVLNSCTYYMRIHGQSATSRHANKIQHFRNLLQAYSKERLTTGSDPIMRGEPVPPPPSEKPIEKMQEEKPNGKVVREDLQYMYALVLNAGDWALFKQYGSEILRCGWKNPKTYRLLLFPILGKRLVKFGVTIKQVFKKSDTK